MKKLEADVIVVAAGMSGLAAAVAAAERGMSVIALEKSGTVGGAANMGMGFFAVESHIQKKQLDSLTVEKAFKIIMEYTHWRVDARLIRKLYGQSASTVKWVEDMGVEWLGAFKYFNDSEATWHIPKMPGSNKPTSRCATLIVKALSDRAQELGVEILFNTPVKKLLRSDTRVTGVIATDESGEEICAEGDAIILCTGGFGDDPEMIKQYLGYEHGKDLFSFRIPGLKGDGMKMAWEIGAGKSPVNMEMTYECSGMLPSGVLDTIMRQPNLMVNYDGLRFINEEIMCNTPYTGNAIALQKQRTGFSIISDEIVDYYREHGIDYNSYHKTVESIAEWDEAVEKFFSGSRENEVPTAFANIRGTTDPNVKFFFKASSIEELAEQTGINAKQLKATVEEYNAACLSGGDAFFGKPQRHMLPIRGKTFYCMKYNPSGYGSLGGIKIDDMLRVVTPEGEPIPGLYSAGTDCCGIFGDSYCFYLPGSTMGYAVNSGRMAGYNAAEYLDSDEFVE